MAYTKLDPTTGDTITQAMLRGMELQYEEALSAAVRALAYATVAQSVTTGNTDALTLDAEGFDTDGLHSLVTNTDRLTIPAGAGGIYLVGVHTYVASASAAGAVLHYKVNGTTNWKTRVDTSAGLGEALAFTHIENLAAGDYISLAGEAVSNAVDFGSADDALSTRLWAVLLARA
jgi:hypothetical protein